MRILYRKGFTLAEILITLSIIGVIASMTIPSLVQDVQDAQLRTAWKKAYADFSQATKMLAAENAGSLKGLFGTDTSVESNFVNPFLKYLNYTRKCDDNTPVGTSGCWHEANKWYKLSGQPYTVSYPQHAGLVTNSGTIIRFALSSYVCVSTYGAAGDSCGEVYFDVNGFKGPNTVGKDIYGLLVLKRGNTAPLGAQGDYFSNDSRISTYSCDVKQYPTTEGWNCSADYLYK